MSDRPLGKSTPAASSAETPKEPSLGGSAPKDPAPRGSASKGALPYPDGSQSSRLPAYAALALAVIAVILAALAYFLPSHDKASAGAVAQQGGDAKTNVCAAYNTVHQGVVINTHLANPNPDDPIGQLSIAANARLALVGGGSYLRERLAANTAAPADLTKAVTAMADTIQQLGVNYLSGAPNDLQDPLRHDLDNQIGQLNQMCA